MVSFSCESCGDVLTKKKLDPHRNHCHGAHFTCLDCQTTFVGTTYRAHTSCITEDQKYQGALYRGKGANGKTPNAKPAPAKPAPAKPAPAQPASRKSVSILEPTDQNALVRHQPFVEEVPDQEVPPAVPTPPSSVDRSRPADSVFDYMVDGDSDDSESDVPRITFADKTGEEMAMKTNAPSVFTDSRTSSRNGHRSPDNPPDKQQYDKLGFAYGTGPVKPQPYGQGADTNPSLLSLDFMSPSARATRLKLEQSKTGRVKSTPVTPGTPASSGHTRTNSGSEKKRKRDYPAGLETDTPMTDAPLQEPRTDPRSELVPAVVHSGLTGGLSKMMAADSTAFPHPQPVGPDKDHGRSERARVASRLDKREDPGSPMKRSRQARDRERERERGSDENGLGITIKGRAVKAMSAVGTALAAGQHGELSKTRRRTSSSDHTQGTSRGGDADGERRERKKHKVHRHNGTSSANIRHEPRTQRRGSDNAYAVHDPSARSRQMKAIEYRKQDGDSEDNAAGGSNQQMVVFGAEASMHARCQTFLAGIPAGHEVDKGYSVHKALKRWHKECDNSRASKQEDEQELWRWLRLKRNDRGEVVLFF